MTFFGHLGLADASKDHSRALHSYILGHARDWLRSIGTPRQSWLRTAEDDLRPLNFGLATRLWTDRHGDYSWRWLSLPDMLLREREREREREKGGGE